MNASPIVKLQMQSDPMLLSGAREMVSWIARRSGFSDMDCSQIALALDEALCNVFRHGYDRQTDRPIWVSIWSEAGTAGNAESPPRIRIEIEDEARQVDPEKIKSRDLDDVRPGGLGVHIIKQVMDEATYAQRPGQGMKLTMFKQGAGPKSALPGASCRCENDEPCCNDAASEKTKSSKEVA
ncbi:MAG: ATP-binding protein [Planctomycetes bacterium]|nr:ATP-binding protein [Planctomycetota bacterium]